MRRTGLWVIPLLAAALLGAYLWLPERAWHRARAFVIAPSPSRYPVRGIDVSHHQGRIDWPRVRAAGYSFAFIKASEGADFRDTRFVENWRAARSAGIAAGAYHFFTFCAPGDIQAKNFLARVPPREAGLPAAVDVEFSGNCRAWNDVTSIHRELRVFVERVEAARGEALLLYTTPDHLDELIPDELQRRAFWLRSLWGEPRASVPWLFWQYSAHGEVPGIVGDVDLDVFVGDAQAWAALLTSEELQGFAPTPR